MTRKDYQLIANAIANSRPWENNKDEWWLQHKITAEYIANALAQDNPRFDKEKFMSWCRVAGHE